MNVTTTDDLVRYVSARSGLTFAGSRGDALRQALAGTVEREYADPGSLLRRLATDEDAFAALCDEMTVRETFFFRERSKLDLLRRLVAEASPARTRAPLRVWSAGCASGEEAYSLAAVLTDAGLHGRFQVVGTDLSPSAVGAARNGSYGRWALRGLDEATVGRLFTVDGDRYHVREKYRTAVEFHQHNLLDPLPVGLGGFDVVFCRNLLIYLTGDAVDRAVHRLVEALAPGGWLVTGVADPLLDRSEHLTTVVTEHGLAYRRVDPAVPAEAADDPATSDDHVLRAPAAPMALVPETPPDPAELPAPAELLADGALALHKAQPQVAEHLARTVLQTHGDVPAAHRMLVQALAEDGRLAAAAKAAAVAVAAVPGDAELQALHAAVLLEIGSPAEARAAAGRAVYLDPGLVHAHLLLGRAHEALGDHVAARRQHRASRKLLLAEAGSA